MKLQTTCSIAIVGIGYVGLPLAVEFGKQYRTIGFDTNKDRLNALRGGEDQTGEVSKVELSTANQLSFTDDLKELSDCNIFIVTVPTPVDSHKRPDLTPLLNATKMIGSILKSDDIVIYESTVYPGVTEESCVPLLERESALKFNEQFFVGYSPERTNPGDREHRITNIPKITSGSTEQIAEYVDKLYSSIIPAGTHKASSIRVAEAAKVIENTQRDVNIALINELAIIFGKLDIDTNEVLEAAKTKWNFLPFKPGLVGGHCIGVDPYYLTYKAESMAYYPDIILASRRLNDGMGSFVASTLIEKMIEKRINISSAKVLILGLTFKEDCPDIRNTKVIDVYKDLENLQVKIDVHDPQCNPQEVELAYGISLIKVLRENYYDAIVIAVAHKEFKRLGGSIRTFAKKNSVIYDLKGIIDKNLSDIRL